MLRQVFVDTHWGRGHACYDPMDDRFFTVGSLAELADGYDEIYLDSSIFPNMWDDLKKLIRAGRRCFYFARPWAWREVRERFRGELRRKLNNSNVKKSDFGDAYLLWRIYELSRIEWNNHKMFRPVTAIDVELRPLLSVERGLSKMKMRLEGQKLLGVDVEEELEKIEKSLEDVRLRLINKAKEIMPWMIKVADTIGVSDSISGITGLIGVLTYFKGSSYHQALRFFGLYKAKGPFGRGVKRCNGVAREYLILLTQSIIRNSNGWPWPPRMRDLRRVLRMVVNAVKAVGSPGGG